MMKMSFSTSMRPSVTVLLILGCFSGAFAQTMTPEMLWQLGRVSPLGLADGGKKLVYKVSYPVVEENTFSTRTYILNLATGQEQADDDAARMVKDPAVSPDGKWELVPTEVKLMKVFGKDFHPDLPMSKSMLYDDLQHRHWDSWADGTYNHLLIKVSGREGPGTDLMKDEPYHCPTKPFGGSDDYTWSPDSRYVVYVAKKLSGAAYMSSTNTDLYRYEVGTGTTVNLTEDNRGYDTHPVYSKQGTLAWLSMARDGYESDKNDIKVLTTAGTINLTAHWDGTVNGFIWSEDGKTIYFNAPVKGTIQLFEAMLPQKAGANPAIRQITQGVWDVNSIVGQSGKEIIASRMDINRAAELYAINIKSGQMRQLTRVNDDAYAKIKTGKVESRWIPTTDGKEMLTWVIYPPDFNPARKYPVILYAQGGPQSALSQFYSFRWNFQLMASQGYIVVAPNRRGMPGHGVAWNEQISGDWGGQNMRDYLSAIDAIAAEPYADTDRMACVGASYGGYSVFYLASMHQGRFRSFISHCGPYNLYSMYGTTEELFFTNWDLGGPYWNHTDEHTQRTYSEFNPMWKVDQWDAPIMIIQGGKDYRVPEGQALEAYTAAISRGIKSRLLYFPDENHWVLKPQNALVWQREFFRWLGETLH